MTDDSSIRYKFDYVMKTACAQTIIIIYIYIWGLDFRLNNIIYLLSIIIFVYHCHYYWTSELLLNLWEYIQGLDITNK